MISDRGSAPVSRSALAHSETCEPILAVKWDSGNKPEIDNTYYVYNCGNDGLYHLALAEEVCPGCLFTCSPRLELARGWRTSKAPAIWS
jgi:hypothetical protein